MILKATARVVGHEGVASPPPPCVFLEWLPNGLADRAKILHSYGASSARFLVKKKNGRIRSGHGATSHVVQAPIDSSRKPCFLATQLVRIGRNGGVVHDLAQNRPFLTSGIAL